MEVRGTRLGEVRPLSPDCHMNTRIGGPKHMVKTNPYQSLMSFQWSSYQIIYSLAHANFECTRLLLRKTYVLSDSSIDKTQMITWNTFS